MSEHDLRQLRTRAAQRRRGLKRSMPVVRIALMLFALLAVVGLTVDLVSLRLRAEKALSRSGTASTAADALIEVTTATNRYYDPAGLFSIRLPRDWAAERDGESGTYDVVLRGPYGIEVGVRVRAAGPGGMDALREQLRGIEDKLHITTQLEESEFHGRPVFHRTVPLNKIEVETVDFLDGDRSVHLMGSAPKEAFADFRPALEEMMESLRVNDGMTNFE